MPRPGGVDWAGALLDYAGAGREVVARLKYRNARSALPFLASGMAELVPAASVDAVTWVPTTPARRRQRGFDQAELLARAVARRLRRPCRPYLRRVPGRPQTGQALAERRRGPTFRARGRPPARVLLVDDVVTTGATAASASRTLRQAGVREVLLVAAARTQPPTGGRTLGHGAVCGSVVASRGQPQAKRPT
ncbi:MAG: ComF family protein [Acidimicrobiales bacterium]|nr:ComF family protein [Actinomycetota bacterium]